MEKHKRVTMMRRRRLFVFGAFFIYLVAVIGYTRLQYVNALEQKLAAIDEKLTLAARGADLLLDGSYHEKAASSTPHTEAEFIAMARRLSGFAEAIGVIYVYSFIEKEGVVTFDATSLTEEEWRTERESAYTDNYLLVYEEATDALKSMFRKPATVYEESSDQWGTFRSVLMPFKTENGLPYVIGADVDIAFVQQEMREEMVRSIYEALFYLLIILPVMFVYWRTSRREKARLHQLVEAQTVDLKEKIARIQDQEVLMVTQSRFAAMGEMLSMIAHQWRQPLYTMTLMISNIKLSEATGSPSAVSKDEALDKISDTLLYLSDTIDDFQNYFKPTKKPEAIALCDLIERAEHFIEARLRHHGISLHIDCPDSVEVETYASEVVQVLINLVNNAVDALVERKVKPAKIVLTVRPDESAVCISLSDNGGGIAEEILPKIFEPYFSTKGKNGTGIGLYMAKMIVEEQIGGQIDACNTEAGASFTITLPLEIKRAVQS